MLRWKTSVLPTWSLFFPVESWRTRTFALTAVSKNHFLINEALFSVIHHYVKKEIKDGNTIHVVRSGKNRAPAAQSGSSSPAKEQKEPEQQPQQREPIPPIPPTPSPSTLSGLGNPFGGNAPPAGGLGAFGGFGGGEMPNMDPELMRQMMDSPFMQNLMGNTGRYIMNLIILSVKFIHIIYLYRLCSLHHYEQPSNEGHDWAESWIRACH